MRKKINSFLIIVSVIMLVVACQPKAWWEDYWWPEKFPEREDPLPTDTVVSAISIPGLLSDVFASGEKGIDVEWLRTDPFSQLMARSSIDGAVADCIYAVVSYSGYSGPAIKNDELEIEEGKIAFEFKLATEIDYSNPVEVLSYNAYVLDEIIIRHHDSRTDYSISSINGITGSATGVVFKISLTNDVLSAELTSDASLAGFDTDVEIEVEINENEIDTSDAMTNEEAAYLVDSDNWFWLFARGEGEGFSTKSAFTENGTEYGFTGTIEFDGYYSNGAIIESGTIAYVSNPVFNHKLDLLTGYLNYTAEISKEAPLVIYLPEKNERFVISGNGITGKLWLYVDASSSEILGMYIYTDVLNGVLTINGQENIERIEKPTATIEDLGIRGAGTKNNPYKIGTETQLRGLAEMVNTGEFNTENVYFLLTNDIDLENRSWIPIGGWDKSKFINYQETVDSSIDNIFKGHFDGGNNTISNLSCDIGCTDYNTVLGYNNFAGLFGIVGAGAEIKNLTIDNADVIVAGFAGGFVGFVPNTDNGKAVVLENLHLTGDINIEGNSNLGGILGNLQETVDLEMRDCTVEGNAGSRIGLFIEDSGFSSASFIGGLAGAVHTKIDDGALIEDCSVSDVEISGNVGLVGGLFGHFKHGTISGSPEKATLSDVSVTISENRNTTTLPDITESLGAIAGTVSNLSSDSYKVILKDISIDDVTLNYPVGTKINLNGLIGRYRENNQNHSNFAEIIEGEETISTEGLTINNPGV